MSAPHQKPTTSDPARGGRSGRWLGLARLAGLVLLGFGAAYALTRFGQRGPTPPEGMVWVPGGKFTMGSEGAQEPRTERPAHAVQVDGFWMDAHEVTNAQFGEFVEATAYVTTAEKTPSWEEMRKSLPPGTPRPPEEKLVPGSMVFTPPGEAVPTDNPARWWTWTPGACWKHPEGPTSDLRGREQHPVVQVSWDDAVAYATWAGKRLPTEAEWEFAARGGLVGQQFVWGSEAPTDTDTRANIWQGTFPNQNTQRDGWSRTAPVKSYAPNGYGLYDMAGNVWEWCADRYRADEYQRRAGKGVLFNPTGPEDSWSPNEPHAALRVTRGGSFLCHVTYCESYRPAARRGTASDTGMSHIGFRCVKSRPARK
ncbi:MAG: formylglycine-generating enzyme family protein [Gemmataceae bacterium]